MSSWTQQHPSAAHTRNTDGLTLDEGAHPNQSIAGDAFNHIEANHRVLIVGDGDMSFSAGFALELTQLGKMPRTFITSTIDTEGDLRNKYPYYPQTVAKLNKLKAKIMHQVDATRLHCEPRFRGQSFDRVIFNFPYVRNGMDNQHADLVHNFLASAACVLTKSGEIVLTLHIGVKEEYQYKNWKVAAAQDFIGLNCVDDHPFNPLRFKDYQTRSTNGKRWDITVGHTYRFRCFDNKHPSRCRNALVDDVFMALETLSAPLQVRLQGDFAQDAVMPQTRTPMPTIQDPPTSFDSTVAQTPTPISTPKEPVAQSTRELAPQRLANDAVSLSELSANRAKSSLHSGLDQTAEEARRRQKMREREERRQADVARQQEALKQQRMKRLAEEQRSKSLKGSGSKHNQTTPRANTSKKPKTNSIEIDSESEDLPELGSDEEKSEYEIESVVGKRVHKGRLEYLAKWKGYSIDESTWEPAKQLIEDDQHQLIDEYEDLVSKGIDPKRPRPKTDAARPKTDPGNSNPSTKPKRKRILDDDDVGDEAVPKQKRRMVKSTEPEDEDIAIVPVSKAPVHRSPLIDRPTMVSEEVVTSQRSQPVSEAGPTNGGSQVWMDDGEADVYKHVIDGWVKQVKKAKSDVMNAFKDKKFDLIPHLLKPIIGLSANVVDDNMFKQIVESTMCDNFMVSLSREIREVSLQQLCQNVITSMRQRMGVKEQVIKRVNPPAPAKVNETPEPASSPTILSTNTTAQSPTAQSAVKPNTIEPSTTTAPPSPPIPTPITTTPTETANDTTTPASTQSTPIITLDLDVGVDVVTVAPTQPVARSQPPPPTTTPSSPSIRIVADSTRPVDPSSPVLGPDLTSTQPQQSKPNEPRPVIQAKASPKNSNTSQNPQAPDFYKVARRLVQMLSHRPEARDFRYPVDTEWVADYGSVVSRPMDLGTIQTKLQAREYASYGDFASDIHLVFRNCISYRDKGAMFRVDYERLGTQAQKLWRLFDLEEEKLRAQGSIAELKGTSRRKKLSRLFAVDVVLQLPTRSVAAQSPSRTTKKRKLMPDDNDEPVSKS